MVPEVGLNLRVRLSVDAACLAARRLDAPLIVVVTTLGRTALALSNHRPTATVLALTRSDAVARLLAVCWGVTATVMTEDASPQQEIAFAVRWAQARGLVEPVQRAVLVRGAMPGQAASRSSPCLNEPPYPLHRRHAAGGPRYALAVCVRAVPRAYPRR